MIRVVMLDLGNTLTDGVKPIDHVPDALNALSLFVNADGQPLSFCLVSDFYLAEPFTQANVALRFSEFLDILEQIGLRDFFEPVDKRVTLSTHANVRKPDRRVFTTALARLGLDMGLESCLFVTENDEHIQACKAMGMQTLTFGSNDHTIGFNDWSDGLMQIAHRVDPQSQSNVQAAFALWAKANRYCQSVDRLAVEQNGDLHAMGQCWAALEGAKEKRLEGLKILVPSLAVVRLDSAGLPQTVDVRPLDPETLAESRAYVDYLSAGNKISEDPTTKDPDKTHIIEALPDGQRFLKRRGFD